MTASLNVWIKQIHPFFLLLSHTPFITDHCTATTNPKGGVQQKTKTKGKKVNIHDFPLVEYHFFFNFQEKEKPVTQKYQRDHTKGLVPMPLTPLAPLQRNLRLHLQTSHQLPLFSQRYSYKNFSVVFLLFFAFSSFSTAS